MARLAVLKPFMDRRSPSRLMRAVFFAGLILYAMFYGAMIAVFPPQLLVFPAIPIFVLAGIVLWMLPDSDAVYDRSMDRLMVFYLGSTLLWPGYIALDLPGLPWVTPTRIAVGMLVAVVLFNLATSHELRDRMSRAMGGDIWVKRCFWGFFVISTLTIPMSSLLFQTINKYANNQVFWTMMFAVTAFLVGTREGFLSRATRVVVWSTIIVALLGILEYRLQRVWWLDHVPGFLKIDPEFLDRIMSSQARAGTDVYRAKSTFWTSLACAEYLAMSFPLVVHYATVAKGFWRTVALSLGAMAMMSAMYLTNARSAMVGLLITGVVYIFLFAWRKRARQPESVGAAGTLFAYPAGVAVLGALVLFWPRLHVAVIGGGAQQASSLARDVQWAMGWPKVLKNPIGHGAGTSGDVLNYTNGAGELTIDTGYLSLLLDYGLLGFAVFFLMIAFGIWAAFRGYMAAESPEEDLLAPLCIGLLNFLIILGVMAVEVNFPFAFFLLGGVAGLAYRQSLRVRQAGPVLSGHQAIAQF